MPKPGGIDGGRGQITGLAYPVRTELTPEYLRKLREDIVAASTDFFINRGSGESVPIVTLRRVEILAVIDTAESSFAQRGWLTIAWASWVITIFATLAIFGGFS